MSLEILLILMLALPLSGAIINGTVGKYLPVSLVGILASAMVFIAFFISFYIFQTLDRNVTINLFTILKYKDISINASFYLDALSIWMSLIITGVGALIHVFSIGYITDKDEFYKFFTYLNLFVFSMLILVLGSNYFLLFFGWEGVGICSFLLIGFNYSDVNSGLANSLAARKAFIMNRIGDLGLLIALFLMINQFGSLEYNEISSKVFAEDFQVSNRFMVALTLCLFFAATGKSAQIPLFTWLPDAMAGPTPVSALIHAATMVTAGIFLIIRSNYLFELAPLTKDIIVYIGLLTSLYGAFVAIRQNDIKKVLAYSTVSQLGLMFVALGTGAYTVALFHVTTHAFFKALLFLCAGSVIHAMSGEQDIRKMGGLKKYLPITHPSFLVGTLAITGFPLFSGFFSKDEIVSSALAYNPLVFVFILISVALTAIYMFRLYFLVFYGKFKSNREIEHHLHESPLSMTVPLIVLSVLSIFGGLINLPGLLLKKSAHWLSDFLNHSVTGLDKLHSHHPNESITWILMISLSLLTIFVRIWAYQTYVKREKTALNDDQLKGWELLSNAKLYIDELYTVCFVRPIEWLASSGYKNFEVSVIYRSVNIFARVFDYSGALILKLQRGILTSYIFWMILGLIFFISYFIINLKFWN